MERTVAALYVQDGGCYFGLDGVDPWPESRDARTYNGPYPVVAHPPCQRWGAMCELTESLYGHRVGDDGGCFAAALESVRAWGGVLEHPANSRAWPAFDLPRPPTGGGWVRGFCGGWSCHVEQVHYGHRAHKATWLYAHGTELPSLRWGRGKSHVWVSWGDFDRYRNVERMPKAERSATPIEFRDLLISIARSAYAAREQGAAS